MNMNKSTQPNKKILQSIQDSWKPFFENHKLPLPSLKDIKKFVLKQESEEYQILKNPYSDSFAPPKNKKIKVKCIHCDDEYLSNKMVFEKRPWSNSYFWYCKNKECDGAGYKFDIFPVE